MKFWELEEILDERMKDPEFKAAFEAEKKVLAAERLLAERVRTPRPILARSAAKHKSHGFSAKLKRTRAMA